MSSWSRISAESCAKQDEFNKSQREAAERRWRDPYQHEPEGDDWQRRTNAVMHHEHMLQNAEAFMMDVDIYRDGDTTTYVKKHGGDALVHTISGMWGTHTIRRGGRVVYRGGEEGAADYVEDWRDA